MTEATLASSSDVINSSSISNPATVNSEIINLDAERRRLVRKTIAAARPVLAEDASRQYKIRVAQKIWNEGRTVTYTCAEQYLRGFGIDGDAVNYAVLRYHPAVLHEPTRRNYPAMLVPVHDMQGNFVGIHRTYLMPDGSGRAKVEAGEDRRMLGDCFGSYVKLRPMRGFRLLITESIETALMIHQSCSDLPVWASMSLGNLKSPVPPAVKELIVYTDGNNRMASVAKKIVMDAVRVHMGRGLPVSMAPPLPEIILKDMRLR